MTIFDFQNFRIFLKYFYEQEKKRQNFSLAQFSKRAGLKSPNYLKLIIDGNRNLTNENIFLFANALKLSQSELEYFEALVNFCQAKNSTIKNYYEQRLEAIRKHELKPTVNIHPEGITKLWYLPACAVAAHNKNQAQLVDFLKHTMGLTHAETLLAIEELCRLKILQKRFDGTFEIIGGFSLVHDAKQLNYSQERFLDDQLSNSRRQFKKQYRNGDGKFISHVMTGPKSSAILLRNDILKLLEKKSNAFDAQADCSKLIQVNIQIFEPKK